MNRIHGQTHVWTLSPAQPDLCAQLAASLKISPLLAQCLINRGQREAAQAGEYLNPRLHNLGDPFLLPGMRKAAECLWQAREQGRRVVVFGDYDVDGITATTLVAEVLESLGWAVACYLPHRMEEGYGLTRDGVENCLQNHRDCKVLLAVDCGTTALDTIAWLRKEGVEVVVLDHHQPAEELPEATALINPLVEPPQAATLSQPGNLVFRELCSAGLAFKLAHALVKHGRQHGLDEAHHVDVRAWLDLVALGTIADVSPLTKENRILVASGLRRLHATQRHGLLALMEVAGINEEPQVHEVAFQLGPRLNAAGRLDSASQALDLLRAPDRQTANELALRLDERNRERQLIERAIVAEVRQRLEKSFNPARDLAIVEADPRWHPGVVGIVASRVARAYYRPAIILGGDGEYLRGSGRSIEGFDLAAALRDCAGDLERHGGHAMAAGLTLRKENLEVFRQRFIDTATLRLKECLLTPVLKLDSEVQFSELGLDEIKDLEALRPAGQGNPPVHLLAGGLTCPRPAQRFGQDQKHARLWFAQNGRTLEAVWWNCPDQPLPSGRLDLAFEPQINTYNGQSAVRLKVLDWRDSTAPS